MPLQANTNAVVHTNKAMNHVEGGWPKEVDYTEAEQVIRFRKKVGGNRPCKARSVPSAFWNSRRE